MAEKEVTKELPTRPPRITWKVVESRHITRAQELKKESKATYTDYVLSLVENFEGKPVALPGPSSSPSTSSGRGSGRSLTPGEVPPGAMQLTKEQTGQVLAAFEALRQALQQVQDTAQDEARFGEAVG